MRLISMKASLDPGAVRISEHGVVLGLLTLFLLIATASLIELLDVSRGKRERSVKLALGATAARLALERALEAFVVCVLATVVGGLLVVAGKPWLAQAWGSDWVTVPRLDGFALAALGGLVLFSCLTISVAPVLAARATRAYAALKEERASTSRAAQRTRVAVIALQVAVSIAFGFCAAELAGGLHALATEPLGIRVANVWDGSLVVTRAEASLSGQGALAVTTQLRSRLESLPGVERVGFASEGPAAGAHDIYGSEFAAQRGDAPPANPQDDVPVTSVDSNYLQLLGSRLLAGRYFTPADASRPLIEGGSVILSQPLAEKLFGGAANAAGRKIVWLGRGGVPSNYFSRVVGVVSGMRTFGLTAPVTAELFNPSEGAGGGIVAIKMKGPAPISLTEVQDVVSDVLPGAHVEGFDSLRHRFDGELAVPRQRLGLLAFFAAISAAVAAFGLASVMLVIIKERDLEIGIRRALGASDRDLGAAVLKQVLPWIGLGLGVGLVFPILFPAPLGAGVASGRAAAVWEGGRAVAAMLVLIAASLWLPLRRAFRRPINDLLRTE